MYARRFLAAAATMAALATSPVPAGAQKIKLPASLRDLEQTARRDSNDAAAHYNLGLAYWNQRRWDDVERAFRTAIAIEYRFALAHLGLSFLQSARLDELADRERKLGDTTLVTTAVDERRRLYQRAIMFDPFVDHRLAGAIPRPRALRGMILIRLWSDYGQALGDLLEGKDEQAYRRLDQMLEEYGLQRDTAPAGLLWFHALAAVRTDRAHQATPDLEALVRRADRGEADSTTSDLRAKEYRYALALLRQRTGDLGAAEALYRQVLGEDLGLYMVHVRLADIYEARERWHRAVAEREEALALNPDDPTSLLELGLTLGKAGRLAAADSTLAAAGAAAPRDARVPYYQGLVAAARGRPADARAAFERFLSLAPARYAERIADARRRLDALP